MGKRKKNKKRPPKLDNIRATELENRPFAGKLAGLKAKKKAQARTERQRLEDEAQQRKIMLAQARADERTVVGADSFRRGEAVEMTDEELFEAALAGLDPIKIDRGKYGGRGPVVAHVESRKPPVSQDPTKPPDAYSSAEALFAAEFGGSDVKRMESNLYERDPSAIEVDKMYRLGGSSTPKSGTTRAEAVDKMLAEGGPDLTTDQRRLLTECGSNRTNLPSTNLRGMSRDVALGTIAAAVKSARNHDLRYLRMITGKGLQSAVEPVLKIALIEWCESMGLRYAPDVLPDGTYGTIIVHVPRRKR